MLFCAQRTFDHQTTQKMTIDLLKKTVETLYTMLILTCWMSWLKSLS